MNTFTRYAASALSCGVLLLAGSTVAMAAPAVSSSVASSQVVASQQAISANYTIKDTGSVTLDGVHTFQIAGGSIEQGGYGLINLTEDGAPLPATLFVHNITPTSFPTDVMIGSGRCPIFQGAGTLHSSGNNVYSGTIRGSSCGDSPASIQVTGLTLQRA